MLLSICLPGLKSHISTVPIHCEDMKGDKKYGIGVFGVLRDHSRSMEIQIAPFGIAHTSSYFHSVVTVPLSCTVSEI